MARTRQAVKPLNQSAQSVATNAAAEKARKAASRAALKAAKVAAATPPIVEAPKPVAPVAKPLDTNAILESLRIDFDAEMDAGNIEEGTTFKAYLAEQGYAADGSALAAVGGIGYQGPMLALRAAAVNYVTGKNGNPHCGDWMAIALDGLTREQVVARLGALLFAKGITTSTNPYLGLNPGQQSMNLRNKARGAYGKGLLNDADLKTLQA